ncbi:MAG: bifunctional DNA primase/polymerase [Rickettsiales bacterium]
MTNIFTSLQKIGFNPIPLKHGTKESIVNWKKYQTQKASIQECQKWDKGKYNVAIITGKISGIWVLDIDGEKAQTRLKLLKINMVNYPKQFPLKLAKENTIIFAITQN